jgi:hypothetical protein
MIRLSLYIFLWITSIAIAIFATQNTYLVNIRFLSFESIKLPLGLVLVFCGGLGATFVTFWQTSINLDLPTVPNFSGFSLRNSFSKPSSESKTSKGVKKAVPNDTSRTSKNIKKDDFDDDWDEEWN